MQPVSGAPTQREPHALPLGTIVGRHRLDMLLGRGGFGAVFAATDTHTGHRSALKILSARVLEQTGGVARFEREAELARRLSHPNSVRVLDAGRDPAGHHYIAFELLEGRSLEHALYDRGAIDPRAAARIALEVLAALDEAHALAIVHRDIKPANIFLVRGERGERVKVLDFGIAKSIRANTRVGLTQEGLTMGTPEYMAPEQISGQDVVPATDLFSLGVVLAEMVVGRSVFPEHLQTSQILMGRLMGQPFPVGPALAGSPLHGVIVRATQNVIAQRFTHAHAFRTAILEVYPDLHDGAAAFTGVALPPGKSGPSLVYQMTEVSFDGRHASPQGTSDARGHLPQDHTPATAQPFAPSFAAHHAPNAPPQYPHPAALAPHQHYQVAQPYVGPSTNRSSAGIWIVLAALLFVVGGGAAGAVFYLSSASDPPRKRPVSQQDDEEETDEVDPPEPGTAARPTTTAPVLPPPKPFVVREVPCAKAPTLNAATMRPRLASSGFRVTGSMLLCTGDMINFRCLSTEGRGWTIDDDGHEGSAVILHFPSVKDANSFLEGKREDESDATLARQGKDVLLVDLPAASADRVVKALCQ